MATSRTRKSKGAAAEATGKDAALRRAPPAVVLTVEGLRAFRTEQSLRIVPITLVLGANGSGKSTLVRMFQVLKQTYANRSAGPILWEGNPGRGEVDFGSLESVMSRGAGGHVVDDEGTRELRLGVSIEGDWSVRVAMQGAGSRGSWVSAVGAASAEIDLEVRASSDGSVRGASFCGHELDGDAYRLERGDPPIPAIVRRDSRLRLPNWSHDQATVSLVTPLVRDGFPPQYLSPTRADDATLEGDIQRVIEGPGRDFPRSERAAPRQLAQPLRWLWLGRSLAGASESLQRLASRSRWVAPVRAQAERLVRDQEVLTDYIAPDGRNLPRYLAGLGPEQASAVSAWVADRLGFGVSARSDGATIELSVELSGLQLSLADVGFGYSQLLPVILQVWQAVHEPASHNATAPDAPLADDDRTPDSAKPVPVVIAIEQPELHLHPRMQADLLRALLALVKEGQARGIDIRLVLETHSEHLVNLLGQHVFEGTIGRDEASVAIVETGDSGATVKNVAFDDDGSLPDWPHDFFYTGGTAGRRGAGAAQ